MNIQEDTIREIIGNISRYDGDKSYLANQIASLLKEIGVKPEILSNPSRINVPSNLYPLIRGLAMANPTVSVREDGEVTISADEVEVVRSLNDRPRGHVVLNVDDGNISSCFYYEKTDGTKEGTVERIEVTTGKYVNGESVVRTMEGHYSIKEPEYESESYIGEGFYSFKEINEDGIQTGLTGVSISNEPLKAVTRISEASITEQDNYVRTYGLNKQLTADMQKNIPPVVDRSPFISHVFTYYRSNDELEKLTVIDKDSKGTKTGYDFAFGGEHGSDEIVRRGVGTTELGTEEEYQLRRDEFYSNPSRVEVEKEKSPLSRSKIDELASNYFETVGHKTI